MTIVVFIYIALLIVFLIISSLVLRHAVKFGYLNPNFKIVLIVFGILAFAVIVFSIYLMFQIDKPAGGYEYNYTESVTTNNLNF